MTTKFTEAQITEARDLIAALLPEGSTATTLVRHVSRSGMSRVISVLAVHPRIGIVDISGDVARVTGRKFDTTHGGVVVKGCGMDMAWELVDRLAYALGFELHQRSI